MDNLSILVVLFLFLLHHFISFINEGGLKNPFNMRLFYMILASFIICIYLIIIFNGHRWRELLPDMCYSNNGLFVPPPRETHTPRTQAATPNSTPNTKASEAKRQ